MTDRRSSSWKEVDLLKGELQKYVKQGLKREEAIDFLRKNFPQFAWSNRTLDERLRHFEVYCKDDTISVEKMLKRLLKRNWKAQSVSGLTVSNGCMKRTSILGMAMTLRLNACCKKSQIEPNRESFVIVVMKKFATPTTPTSISYLEKDAGTKRGGGRKLEHSRD
ncbi:hypothetical protein pdam_00008511 [Pocillopora damicornis]|uniref:Uncharacterized protein n=1 Tax=Pocillopora damicornis TaxID=46731 RepID=A0A3M6U4D4_POCDA|nr:hypothetical protein pdam_00008511 [Pocillopora damicornis]